MWVAPGAPRARGLSRRGARPRYACRMAVKVSWQQALAWRMQRQQLDPVGRLPVEAVVRRL